MDPVEIDVDRMEAGRSYLAALRRLGLEPDGLFWAVDRLDDDKPILMLVTRYFDIVGPTALSSLLFKAYNASATPREIDPFVVRLHSPDHHMLRTIITAMDKFDEQVVKKGRTKITPDSYIDTGTVAIPLGQVYVWNDVRRPKIDMMRRWGFITKKVDAVAA